MNDTKNYTFKAPGVKDKPPAQKIKRKKPILIIVLAVALFLIVVLLTAMFTPSLKSDIKLFGDYLKIVSLSGGEDFEKQGITSTALVASAVTKGNSASEINFPQTLGELFFESSDGGEVSFVILHNPENGQLASKDNNGNVIKLFMPFARFVFSNEQSENALITANPSPILVDNAIIEPFWFDTVGETIAGNQVTISGGTSVVSTFEQMTENAPSVTGLTAGAVTVTDGNGEQVFSGEVEALASFKASSNGLHSFEIKPNSGITYKFNINYSFLPEISISNTEIIQAGAYVISAKNIGGDISAQMYDSDGQPMGPIPTFMEDDELRWAYVPISYRQQPGNYSVEVTVGEHVESFDFEVVKKIYEQESFELEAPGPSETVDIPPEQDFNVVYSPLYFNFDPEVYWEGLFIPPVADTAEGYWVSSTFGVERYITYTGPYGGYDGVMYHVGVDFACKTGTPIVAPNHGKVLFAGFLMQSGGTIMIEHGNGLHSIYYHLDETIVETGDMVEKGQEIGLVGSTGWWSTGPHLHFAMMIGEYNIDPTDVLEGTSGIYELGDVTGNPVTETTDFKLSDGF